MNPMAFEKQRLHVPHEVKCSNLTAFTKSLKEFELFYFPLFSSVALQTEVIPSKISTSVDTSSILSLRILGNN